MNNTSVIRRNKFVFICNNTLQTIALLCLTGPIMQTFLSEIGIAPERITLLLTVHQLTNVAGIVLCSRFADRGNVFHRYAFVAMPLAGFFLLYLPLCFSTSLSSSEAFLFAVAVSAAQALCLSLHTVCAYKLPYFALTPQDYAQASAIAGIVGGLISLATGPLMTFLASRYEYTDIMKVAFPAAAVSAGLGALVCFLFRDREGAPKNNDDQPKIPLVTIFKNPVFYKLFFPNLFRGISAGITTIFATVAIIRGFDTDVSLALVSIQSIATFGSCGIFALLSKKIRPCRAVLCGTVLFLFAPLMLTSDKYVFLGAALAVLLGKLIVDIAVPAAVMTVVPADIAGPYSAWRMILHNGGMAIGTAIASFLPVPVLLILCVVLQLFSGIVYAFSRVMNPPAVDYDPLSK